MRHNATLCLAALLGVLSPHGVVSPHGVSPPSQDRPNSVSGSGPPDAIFDATMAAYVVDARVAAYLDASKNRPELRKALIQLYLIERFDERPKLDEHVDVTALFEAGRLLYKWACVHEKNFIVAAIEEVPKNLLIPDEMMQKEKDKQALAGVGNESKDPGVVSPHTGPSHPKVEAYLDASMKKERPTSEEAEIITLADIPELRNMINQARVAQISYDSKGNPERRKFLIGRYLMELGEGLDVAKRRRLLKRLPEVFPHLPEEVLKYFGNEPKDPTLGEDPPILNEQKDPVAPRSLLADAPGVVSRTRSGVPPHGVVSPHGVSPPSQGRPNSVSVFDARMAAYVDARVAAYLNASKNLPELRKFLIQLYLTEKFDERPKLDDHVDMTTLFEAGRLLYTWACVHEKSFIVAATEEVRKNLLIQDEMMQKEKDKQALAGVGNESQDPGVVSPHTGPSHPKVEAYLDASMKKERPTSEEAEIISLAASLSPAASTLTPAARSVGEDAPGVSPPSQDRPNSVSVFDGSGGPPDE